MTDYQDALVLENLDLVNWVIRTRISIPNRPLLTYDDFYAIGCEAICRAALKYQPDMGAFAPFACRYIYNAIVDHCRAMNYRLERNVEISEDENASLLDMLTCTSVDFDETVTDATAMSALAACKEKYNGVARKGVEAIEMKLKGYEATEIAKHYALFYLELTSGLRRGELLGLEWADLNPETRMLTVNKQLTRSGGELCISVPKTENSIRTIALPENTVALLIDEHNKHPDSPLMFWCPRTNGYWSPDSLRHLHKQMLAAAGVDESVRFHDLRHTFSTLAIQSGVDAKTVAGMLGHYSAAFTLDTYTHVTEQMKRGAAEKIGVFMNASVNVQVNVVHSPSAVVRGDYESDLANCLNPSNSTDLDPTSQ